MKKIYLKVAITAIIIAACYYRYCGYMKDMNGYVGEGDYCLINEKGEVVSDLRIYDTVYARDGDLGGALVILENGWPRKDARNHIACALLDSNGKIVLGPSYMWIRHRGQRLFNVEDELYDFTGNKMGKIVELGHLGRFGKNGLAPLDNSMGRTSTGYIDTTGNYVIDNRFVAGDTFADNGLAAVENTEELWGYIDETGSYVIEPQFIKAGMFSDGLAPVKISDGHWAYIRENGEIAFEVDCYEAEEFLHGCAVIRKDDSRYYIINTDGNRINNEDYEDADISIALDIITVCKNNRANFIGFDGKPIFDKTFDYAWEFSRNGLCAVCGDNGLWGYIGTDGEWVIEPVFEEAYPFDSKACVAVVKPVKPEN